MSSDPTSLDPDNPSDLIGSADIVAAFTALRHELKLQVRAGRDLSSGLEGVVTGCLDRRLEDLTERLSRMETAIHAVATGGKAWPAAGSMDAVRPLAIAVAEIEESLERAVAALTDEARTVGCLAMDTDEETDQKNNDSEPADPAADWDSCLAESPWLVRILAAPLVGRLRQIFDSHVQRAADDGEPAASPAQEAVVAAATSLADAGQGLELALVRTRRLMEQAGMRRIDVLYEPFDAEQMRAIDVSEDSAVPQGHVAKQFRPGYLLHGTVLRPAEVGVSR